MDNGIIIDKGCGLDVHKETVLDGLAKWTPEAGTPQGAVIIPLLANLYLHPVDQAMEAAGLIMIRYADDFVIMCKDEAEANRALHKVSQLITERGLVLHPEKTRVVNTNEAGQGFDFLGYHFERGTRWPRKKSLKKLKDAIRSHTGRSNGHSLPVIAANLNRTLKGWFEYFKHSRPWVFPRLDMFIRQRLRTILRKRHKLRGCARRGMDSHRWPNAYFTNLGLFNLVNARALVRQSSAR
jgi:RNA-directed DNA polymerase